MSVCLFSRRKATVSRERLKLLFKQHCEPVNGTIAVKVITYMHVREAVMGSDSCSRYEREPGTLFVFCFLRYSRVTSHVIFYSQHWISLRIKEAPGAPTRSCYLLHSCFFMLPC